MALALSIAVDCAAASLDGYVKSRQAGELISYAQISLTPEGANANQDRRLPVWPIATGSNQDGYYAFRSIPAARYVLRARAFGYVERTVTIDLGDAPTRLDVLLEVEPIRIPTVDVDGAREEEQRTEHPPGLIQLSAKRLQRLPAVGEQDLIRSLQLLPGVQAASDLSSGLYIRGGGPDQTLILLDQVPLYNPTHAFGIFSTFNPSATKDVSLYKGAYPSQFGGRLGSVLDVSNREGNRQQFRAAGGVSLIAGRLTAEGPIQNGSWIVSARRTYLDPILDAVRNDSTEVPSYYFYDVNARINRSLGPADNVVLSGYRGRDVLRLDLDRGSYLDVRWGNAAATAKWTHVYGPRLFGNLLLSASEYRSDTDVQIFTTPLRFSNRLFDVTARADIDWHPSPAHEVDAGVSASLYEFRLARDVNQVPQPSFDQSPGSVTLYAEDQWKPTSRWSIRPGLRAEVFGARGRVGLEPRLMIGRMLSPTVRVSAGGGGYSQHLQLVSTEGFSGGDFWVPIDQSTQAGRSWQTVGGVEWEPSPRYSVALEGYYTWLRHLVRLDSGRAPGAAGETTEDIFLTGGRGWASGMELFARKRTGRITGWIGYTLGSSRRTWADVNQGNEFPPKYDRRHDLKIVTQVEGKKWSYGLNFLFGTGQAFTPAAARYELTVPGTEQNRDSFLLPGPKNSARLLPYHRMDVSVTRHGSLFGSRADYFLQIFNVYNRRNEWFIQYNTDGRSTDVKVVHQLPIVPTFGINFAF